MNNRPEVAQDSRPAKAGKREWIGLAVIALPCLLYSMDLTVLNLAVPYLSMALKPSGSELLWILDIYGFMLAGCLITMGTLGDRIGRRKLLLIGAGAFGAASVLAASANTTATLIAARAMLGIAGATLAPSTLSLIQNMFTDPKQRSLAIGIWVTSFSAGGAIGPIVGGALLAYFQWGSVFLISVPVMLILLLVGPFLLPEYKDATARPVDIVSVITSLFSILAIIFGLKQIAAYGFDWISALSIVTGLLMGVFFLRRQKKLRFPLIDLSLFGQSSFNTALLIYTFSTFVLFGFFVFTYQYMQLVVGFDPIEAGLWSMPNFLAFIIGSLITPTFAQKFPPIRIIVAGLLLAAVGFGLVTQLNGAGGLLFLVGGSFLYCLGIAPIITLTTDMIVGAAPPEKSGIASALSETGSEFGGALGIAILGTLGTSIYRNRMAQDLADSGLARHLKAIPQTLAEAIQQAPMLPENLSRSLIEEAHQAFIKGMQLTALTCGLILMIMALFCLRKIGEMELPLKQASDPEKR